MPYTYFKRQWLLVVFCLSLVGVGFLIHTTQKPKEDGLSYQERVDTLSTRPPASHHNYPGALGAGAKAPNFSLKDHHGQTYNLKNALAKGPVVLTFFRGNWCPLCAAHLAKIETIQTELSTLGAQSVAISAQTPEKTAQTQSNFGITFPVLSDEQMRVTKAYGVDWEIPQKEREKFSAWLDKTTSHKLNHYQNTEAYTLPVPATYVIAPSGDIVYAHVDENYKNRAEPELILQALRRIK